MTSPASPPSGLKRAYEPDERHVLPPPQHHRKSTSSPPLSSSTAVSAFRNVSACHRCRNRKNRCDQRLPACRACEKARTRCTGWDPITKREIPRSYLYYLETRLSYLEALLVANDVEFDPPEAFEAEYKAGPGEAHSPQHEHGPTEKPQMADTALEKKMEETEKLNQLVSNIGMVSVEGASDHRYLGSTSGISFARVVFAAVRSSLSTNNSERAGVKPSRPAAAAGRASAGGSSMRDSYFGLQTKPTIKKAAFPDRPLGEKLVNLYFEHANPQIPILHRGEYMSMFNRVYDSGDRASRDLYLLNIVFAVGAGTIFGSSDSDADSMEHSGYAQKRPRLVGVQHQPEEYHASAIEHLEAFLGAASSEKGHGLGGNLEELQAVLLLASFALLRPVAPGLWYITGVAMRLAVDLGLHYEEHAASDGLGDSATMATRDMPMAGTVEDEHSTRVHDHELGRRDWYKDLRRRLWWCVYTFDRLVSTCVGRPFGISDQVVTAEFPSSLDDAYITKTGFLRPPPDATSYKLVSHHYLRLRLLQSEILQVLQYQQAEIARQHGANAENQFMHTGLQSPFLGKFRGDFRAWRKDIDRRLWMWKEAAPAQRDTGVGFQVQFLELNYWQAVTMLYRQSLIVPGPLASETSPTDDVASPTSVRVEEREDEDEVFLKCAEAGQKTLKLYRQLHRMRLVNYTYLATHHLFMAGISFLYAIWHSPAVRAQLTLDDVDFTVLAATSVLGDLITKCPPAEACRDAFERMSKATVQMCMSTGGFGMKRGESDVGRLSAQPRPSMVSMSSGTPSEYYFQQATPIKPRRPVPKFDMNLRDLFPDDLDSGSLTSQSFPPSFSQSHRRSSQTPRQPTTMSSQHPQSFQSQMQSYSAVATSPPSSVGRKSIFDQDTNTVTSPTTQSQPHSQSFALGSYYGYNTLQEDFAHTPGMDFLNLANNEYDNDASGGFGGGGGLDTNFDLNFGMGGLEFTHDGGNVEGGNGFGVDLFDGFFFGGNGFGAPGGGGGGSGGGN